MLTKYPISFNLFIKKRILGFDEKKDYMRVINALPLFSYDSFLNNYGKQFKTPFPLGKRTIKGL